MKGEPFASRLPRPSAGASVTPQAPGPGNRLSPRKLNQPVFLGLRDGKRPQDGLLRESSTSKNDRKGQSSHFR
jgi:hypothetical protein